MKARKRATSAEAIAKRNAAFEKLTPAQKRVVVAKDVIAALNANQIVARASIYLDVSRNSQFTSPAYSDDWHAELRAWGEADAQEVLLKQEVSCSACAIGSVFVCAVERMDKLTLHDLKTTRRAGMRDYLSGIFTEDQLDLMEIAFERTEEHATSEKYANEYHHRDEDWGPRTNGAESDVKRALEFGSCYEGLSDYDEDTETDFDADGCMRAIMKNIIANGGEFKP